MITPLSEYYKDAFKPTNDQVNALEALSDFFLSSNKVFILKGYAGTGKTTLTKLLADYCKSISLKPIFMAPTGRAARIISEKTKHSATTIHKAIYDMTELDEIEIKKDKKIQYKFRYKLKNYDESITNVFFVDEASLISDKLSEDDFFVFGSGIILKDLIEYITPNNLARKDKLIFIGDGAQLPPVTDNISGALNAEYLFMKYAIKVNEYQLTEVVRQEKESGILFNATELRKTIKLPGIKKFTFNKEFNDVQEINELEAVEFYLKSNPNLTVNDGILLTSKNKTALEYNLKIRTHFFKEIDGVEKGETLLINQNNYNYEIELLNGTLVKIIDVDKATITKSNMPSYDADGNECFVSHRFRWLTLEVPFEENKNNQIKCLILDNFLFSPERALTYSENIALYIDFKLRNQNLKPKTIEFAKAFKSDPFVNALRVKFGYAITVHKAQGGEWDNVIVNMDFYSSYSSELFFRWAYTAITRASKKLIYFNYKNSLYSKLKYQTELISDHNIMTENEKIENKIELILTENHLNFIRKYFSDEPAFLIEKYKILLAQLQDANIEINSRKKMQYAEEYTFSKNNKTMIVIFYYNGKNEFTRVIEKIINNQKNDFSEELIKLLHKSVEFTIAEDSPNNKTKTNEITPLPLISFSEDLKPLEKLYSDLTEMLTDKEVLITNVEHSKYLEKYFFVRENEKAMIQFWYDGLMQYTTVKPHIPSCNSNILLDDISELIKNLV